MRNYVSLWQIRNSKLKIYRTPSHRIRSNSWQFKTNTLNKDK